MDELHLVRRAGRRLSPGRHRASKLL